MSDYLNMSSPLFQSGGDVSRLPNYVKSQSSAQKKPEGIKVEYRELFENYDRALSLNALDFASSPLKKGSLSSSLSSLGRAFIAVS